MRLLLDLRELASDGRARASFVEHVAEIRARHGRKYTFVKILDAAGLDRDLGAAP